MAEKVTSADVAELAGVSRSAVSRVFTPGASASAAMVAKVSAAADRLGYRPNVLARALLTGESRMIGLVVSYLDNHFYPQVLEKLSRALQSEGYHILMFMAGQEPDQAEKVVAEILDYQIHGLVLASVSLSSDLGERCRALGVPVVLLNRRQGEVGELAVVSDNARGGRLAAQHLIARGCQRIAHITGAEGASTQQEREAGFLEGLRMGGFQLSAREVGGFDAARARAATRAMFSPGADRPDGLFVANDYMALVVMDTLRYELGLQVPNDVAVIGFDDVPAAAWPAYDLTSIRQDADAMVRRTADLLLGREIPQGALQVRLVPRRSA
ncbi:MAG: LacI family DNA-binding transcriptional regulator [Pseudomonadota bacterium]